MDPKENENSPVQQLRDRLAGLVNDQTQILQTATAAGRDTTDEEKAKVKEIQAKVAGMEEEIALRINAAEAQARLDAPQGRKVEPSGTVSTSAPAQAGATSTAPQGRQPIYGRDVAAESKTHGFATGQDWFKAIRNVAINPSLIDRRLTNAQAAATTFANEGSGPEGGWAMPPEYASGIVEAVMGQASLLGKMRPMQSNSNIYQIPVDESTGWGSTGVQAAKTAEGAAATVSNLALQGRTVTLHKAVSFVNVSEELSTDNPACVTHITRVMSRQLQGVVERWLLRGTGMNQPVGILNAPALVEVAQEAAGNGAGTLIRKNLAKCAGRVIPGLDSEMFWVMSPSAKIEALDLMLAASGNGGEAIQQGFRGQSLLGYPFITSMEASAVGTKGDATMVAPSGFLTLVKGGVQSQATIYFYFDQGLQTLRSYIRVGQVPILSAAIAPKEDASTTLSHCVTTATRS
jgi:HK97 family phage major capsid protein